MAHDYSYNSADVHPHYTETIVPIETVRDCVEGSWRIKREKYTYLPHPSQVDTSSKEQQARYDMYIKGAEFDNYPALSLRAWLGKMRVSNTTTDLPERLNYLIQNADGDGTPLLSALESCASNIFQTKYHVLVADYQGLSDIDISQLTKADAEKLAPRATIKQYTREALVDWNYRRINGVMQLSYVKLRETGYEFNPETNVRDPIESFLTLALDEEGNYYQYKEVDGEGGERDYVTIGGSNLKWLPVEIVSDEELPVGDLPQGMGMLYPICESALYRYRVSADYKEAMRYLVPTTFTKGWKQGDKEIFVEVNGREQMAWGPGCANNLPNEVEVDIKSVNTELEGFERYFEANSKKVKALGGVFKDGMQQQRTATEADIDATEQNAMLESIASQLEYAWKRMVAYCGMFEGLFQPDAVESALDQIVIDLPRDFATPKLSVEEVRVLLDAKTEGLYTTEQAIKILEQGGWGAGEEIEVWLANLKEEAPSISSIANQLPRQEQDSQ